MATDSVNDFYWQGSKLVEGGLGYLLPDGITREIGHFNVFNVGELVRRMKEKPIMPYNRRAYYKISLINRLCLQIRSFKKLCGRADPLWAKAAAR